MKKPWYKSRTLWFNAIVAALAALEAAFGAFETVLPGNVYAWMLALLTMGNAVLRVLTTQGIAK